MSGIIKSVPAKVYPVGQFVLEELDARQWTIQDAIDRIEDDISKLAFGLIMMKPIPGLILGDKMAEELSRLFGGSKKYWLNLDKAWQEHPQTLLEKSEMMKRWKRNR